MTKQCYQLESERGWTFVSDAAIELTSCKFNPIPKLFKD